MRDVLAPETADRLAHCLREEVPWGLATQLQGSGRTFLAPELQAMPPGELQALLRQVQGEAREGYQFFFNSCQMVAAYKENAIRSCSCTVSWNI